MLKTGKVICGLLLLTALSGCVQTPNHTITFETNGGSDLSSLTGRSGAKIVTEPVTTREGYVFKGWYADADLTKKVPSIASYPYADVTLYAKWARIISVSFETNGGLGKTAVAGVEGESVDLGAEPVRTNYYFDAWYTDPELTLAFTADKYPDQDFVLYAGWESYPTLSFVTNYHDVAMPKLTLPKGAEIPSLDLTWMPTTNPKFDGWYRDEALTEQFYPDKMPDSSLTVYAKWTYLRTITFETDGGTTVAPLTAYAGEAIAGPIHPDKSGYYLDGWYETTDGPAFTFEVMPDRDLTLHAKWVENPTVRFYDNYDPAEPTLLGSVSYAPNSKISDPKLGTSDSPLSLPNHPEDEFLGWYLKENDNSYTPFFFTDDAKIGQSSLELYARWRKKITVTFPGSAIGKMMLSSDKPSVTEAPFLADQSQWLVGWYESIDDLTGQPLGNPIAFPYTTDHDVTLYPYSVLAVTLTLKIGASSFVIAGGAGLEPNIPDTVWTTIDAYLKEQNWTRYLWKIEVDGRPGPDNSELKEMPAADTVLWLVENTETFNPDIDL